MNITAVLNRPELKLLMFKSARVLIISSVLFYLLFVLDLSSIYTIALQSNIYFLSAALFLLPLNLLLQFYKWRLSCRYYLSVDNNKRVISSLFAGFPAALFTPARAGEYVGRGLEFREKKLIDITSAVFTDKLFTLFSVVLFGAAGAMVILNISIIYLLLSVSVAGLTLLLLKKINIKLKLPQIKLPDYRFSIEMLFLSLCFYLCYIVQFVLLLSAFAGMDDIITLFSAAGLIMFIKTIIPNFISGEIGIRESASVFFLSYIGKDPAAGFNASILLFIINLAIPSLIGLIPLLRKNR